MTSLEANGCKCMNQSHFTDAEELLGHPVKDNYTMNAFYDRALQKVTLKCYWCDYEAEVDVGIRPVQVKQFVGGYLTLGPPAT